MESLNRTVSNLTNQINNLTESLNNLNITLGNLDADLIRLNLQLQNYTSTLASINSTLEDLADELSKLENLKSTQESNLAGIRLKHSCVCFFYSLFLYLFHTYQAYINILQFSKILKPKKWLWEQLMNLQSRSKLLYPNFWQIKDGNCSTEKICYVHFIEWVIFLKLIKRSHW